MTEPDFKKLCSEYGVDLEYSEKFGIYLLMGVGPNGNIRPVPLVVESLEDLQDEEIESFIARIALSHLAAG